MSDISLRQDILDELDFEPSVDAASIGVVVDDGVVTLNGHVQSYAQKLAAESATRRVKGVRAIAQEIEVRYPSDKKTADDEIAKRALNILSWNSVVPNDGVQLTVRDGWITLGGTVNWQYQRSAAEDAVRKLSGVSGVINSIAVRPRVQSADVRHEIESAFKRNAELEAHGISVTVLDGGRISLSGRVHDWHERAVAEQAAWSAPGVVAVDDRLTIG